MDQHLIDLAETLHDKVIDYRASVSYANTQVGKHPKDLPDRIRESAFNSLSEVLNEFNKELDNHKQTNGYLHNTRLFIDATMLLNSPIINSKWIVEVLANDHGITINR
jgi:hypothetical protein